MKKSKGLRLIPLAALILFITAIVVLAFAGRDYYRQKKYQRLVAKATITPVKVFQIGFSKCGTPTLSAFFSANGVLTVHHDEGRLPVSIYHNALQNRPLLSPIYDQYAVFTDMERLYADPPINVPVTLFKELDQQYPGSKFILNTRDKQAWLLSRATQLLQVSARIVNKTPAEVLAEWSKEWDEHHRAVLEYFKERPNDLLVFNIETDRPEKLTEFLKDYFVLDPKLFNREKQKDM